jgi:hypothetical protein
MKVRGMVIIRRGQGPKGKDHEERCAMTSAP